MQVLLCGTTDTVSVKFTGVGGVSCGNAQNDVELIQR